MTTQQVPVRELRTGDRVLVYGQMVGVIVAPPIHIGGYIASFGGVWQAWAKVDLIDWHNAMCPLSLLHDCQHTTAYDCISLQGNDLFLVTRITP